MNWHGGSVRKQGGGGGDIDYINASILDIINKAYKIRSAQLIRQNLINMKLSHEASSIRNK